jgi:enoyl-CoA hydratase/carnithine racemase
MPYVTITYQQDSGIGRITINRPEAMNAITLEVLGELKAAVIEAGNDPGVKVIVLAGAGRAFCAGVDLKALGGLKMVDGRAGDVLDKPGWELIERIRNVPKVVIALIHGYCFTGALEIVLACDLVLAAEETKIGDTHAKWGLHPTWGMSARLPRRVGFLKAKELSFTADAISGKEAERIGLVNKAVPAAKLEEALQVMVKKIAANSPQSVALYKRLYNANESMSLDKSLELEISTEFTISDTEERVAQFRK